MYNAYFDSTGQRLGDLIPNPAVGSSGGWASFLTTIAEGYSAHERAKLEREYLKRNQTPPASLLTPPGSSAGGVPSWLLPAGIAIAALLLLRK